ncbi:hypothetical protein GCM10010169_48560 [Micromonospora fulviviridis]|uniref:CIS tube protein n=1 Tax=Micromonospora fulviviridis TaxID=47860 RepID=UPI001668780A|nr:hypothetical protein [Micromonospora fulviviridis]GGR98278.1 hypothetical protein GCM10010169_48560 [Micromonospora fulviviridis]
MEFKKASLQEVSPQPTNPPKNVGNPIEVQINPATLRVQMTSTADFGKDAGRQKTQYQGSTSTLTFDLVYDTADEGTTEAPVDVRTRTRQLERFVLPQMAQAKSVPPRLRFTYGTFSVVGVMTALNTDFDFFAASGTPLRAKCAVTIKVQNPEFDANLAGAGTNTGAGATPPVPPGAGGAGAQVPPTPPPPDRTGTALAGESAPDFANRMGLDPRAWKGLQGITDPVRLEAGQRIDFSASLSLDAGLGVEIALRGRSGRGANDRPGDGGGAVPARAPAGGPALTAAGGLTRALDRAAAHNAGAAAERNRNAFAADAPAAGAAVTVRAGDRAPLPAGVPVADRRAVTFGFGVPLRPRLAAAGPASTGLVHVRGRTVASGGTLPPQTDDPTVPGWRALAAVPAAAAAAPVCGCRCACGRSCGGG